MVEAASPVINGFPDVSYADADGVSIAFSVRGDGATDVVRVPGVLNGVLACTVDPVVEAHYSHIATFSRLIVLDRRGLGMSDPLLAGGGPQLEQQVADLVAVMDAASSDKATLYASGDGTPVAVLFAAMYPGRVSGLIFNNGYARLVRAPDYPFGPEAEQFDHPSLSAHERWGDRLNPWGIEFVAPSRVADPGFREVLARVQQVSASRAAAAGAMFNPDHDVRDVLPLVQAPALVLCGAENPPDQALGRSQFLVDHLPNARLSCYPGADTYFGVHTPELGARIEEFVTGIRPPPVTDRVLATVLFTDVVATPEVGSEIDGQQWRTLTGHHDAVVRKQLERFRGREVNSNRYARQAVVPGGSGTDSALFATFDGPARALRCAQAIIDDAHDLGVEVRAGVHVGECTVRADDLAGIAVHIGARLCALAAPGEVLATTTVRDLVAGSGIDFTDRGRHSLKGIEGEWELLAALP